MRRNCRHQRRRRSAVEVTAGADAIQKTVTWTLLRSLRPQQFLIDGTVHRSASIICKRGQTIIHVVVVIILAKLKFAHAGYGGDGSRKGSGNNRIDRHKSQIVTIVVFVIAVVGGGSAGIRMPVPIQRWQPNSKRSYEAVQPLLNSHLLLAELRALAEFAMGQLLCTRNAKSSRRPVGWTHADFTIRLKIHLVTKKKPI